MKRNRLLSAAAALVFAASLLTACGDSSSASESKTESKASASQSSTESSEVSGGLSYNSNTPKPEKIEVSEISGEVRDITPAELVSEMGTGWNMGNSLDAEGGETAWGNPMITKEMIDAVSEKGFNVIRIPVTWDGHFGEGPDYTIDEDWMDRVQQVVNYAIEDDMFVILNSHHEEKWRIPDDEHIEIVDETVAALWTQIAERFKNYGDKLVFEGLNEPRVKGGAREWDGGTEEGRKCLDRLNQTFLDSVRATGGNNEKRLCLITTFASQSCNAAVSNVAIPDDAHMGMSIHAYTPYAFTYHPNETWELYEWDGSQNNQIDNLMYSLNTLFNERGIPVIITEYGAVNKDYNDDQIALWATHYLEAAKAVGIPCVWWDNGYYFSGNELFGIFNRNDCTWYSPTIADALVEMYK